MINGLGHQNYLTFKKKNLNFAENNIKNTNHQGALTQAPLATLKAYTQNISFGEK